jgi:hypothetical protein
MGGYRFSEKDHAPVQEAVFVPSKASGVAGFDRVGLTNSRHSLKSSAFLKRRLKNLHRPRVGQVRSQL